MLSILYYASRRSYVYVPSLFNLLKDFLSRKKTRKKIRHVNGFTFMQSHKRYPTTVRCETHILDPSSKYINSNTPPPPTTPNTRDATSWLDHDGPQIQD